ncbi:protein VAPYRIN-LIKE-like [Tripterygium wilfordii]|uniref:protein VAPYRIN-LIKE-like n=1 Tax=Tripterygium wilfordii TaxID=458696 RepID=UPI0018F85D2B|nr:protein VAPYRIN-LIKE-like [Tripterygium wilfordii]
MDRLVKPDVKEVELTFRRGQKSTVTFRLTNLMHTMSVGVSLTTSNPSFFSFNQPYSIIQPLSTSSYTLLLSKPSDKPPIRTTADVINVRSSMLPTGKANQDDLRRLFAKPGSHVFRDATIPITFVGPHVVDYLIFNNTQVPELNSLFSKAISGCTESELTNSLRSAVASANEKLVAVLIENGGDVNSKDLDGRSMISLAVRAESIDVVRVLVASGCIIDETIDRVLQEVAAMNRVDLMEVLITNYKNIDANSVDWHGRTPIHVAAGSGHVEMIRYCVSIGGNTDLSDCDGWTALHFAAEKGHLEATECLLKCSSYAKYAVNKEGKTAFMIAVENGHSNLYDLLQLGDALHRAARVDDVHGMKSCLSEGAKVNGRDQNGWTPLHRAAFKGRVESVKILLSHGAEIDVVDDAGYTPLHCAVEAGQVQVSLLLIAHGAKANLKSLKGLVPRNLDCFQTPAPFALPLCHEDRA